MFPASTKHIIRRFVNPCFWASPKNRFGGFDYLRAFFSIVVVALHANLFNFFVGKPRLNFISDILNLNIGYLAVPIFLQVSLFLFCLKREQAGHQYFVQKRLPKLLSLYLFWSISKLTFDFLFKEDSWTNSIKVQSLIDLAAFIIGGGNTIFYFFFSLLFLTLITELLILFFGNQKLSIDKLSISYYLLIGSSLLIFSFPLIDIIYGNEMLTNVINPINFLPYIFTSIIVAQEFNSGKLENLTSEYRLKIIALSLLFLFLAGLEWFIFKDASHSRLFPHYSRLSLVVASWIFLYLALFSIQQVPTPISFLAGCSLGIYGFHTFFLDYMSSFNSIPQIIPGMSILIKFMIALLGSITLTIVFRKTKWLKNFV